VMPWKAVGHSPTLTLISTINGAVLLLATDWRSARLRDRVLSVGLLLGGVWLALGILGNELHGRYLIMLLPMLWVWAGHTLTRLPRGLGMLWVGCWVGAPVP
jgi:ABC-type Fe3+ transport system permease subunit